MSLAATLAQNYRVQSPAFSSDEFRVTNTGMLNAFQMQTAGAQSFVTQELAARALTSAGRDVKIPAINYKDVTIRTTRPLVIPADENTSAFYTVTWVTFAYGFLMYNAQHYNNDISRQQDFNGKFQAMQVKMADAIESTAVAAVESAKTQVIGQVTGNHTFASNVVSETGIGNLKDSYILTDLQPMMRSNDFNPFMMDVVGNAGMEAVTNRLDGFGQFNQENKTIMYGGKRFQWSNNVANAAGKNATGYAISDGTLGMLTRVEPDSILRTRLKTGHEWGTVVMPGLNVLFGTYSYDAAVDASTLGAHAAHLTRTGATAFDFATDLAFVIKYSSDRTTIPSGIIKFDIDTD